MIYVPWVSIAESEELGAFGGDQGVYYDPWK
jgi:hypothetical protein